MGFAPGHTVISYPPCPLSYKLIVQKHL